jgi:predicted O-methyltransferase YrrM
MEAVKHFAPETLDFVYIDANHDYSHVLEDIEAWAKIVKPGGIVSGHDYGHYKYWFMTLGSRRAIDTYVKNHGIKMLFLPNRNYQTSWFFVKE